MYQVTILMELLLEYTLYNTSKSTGVALTINGTTAEAMAG
jgi:hypothetical protein